MAFTSHDFKQIVNVGAGVLNPTLPHKISTYTINYNSPLIIGRIAQIKNGKLTNLDGTAAPVIAGLVLSSIVNPMENGNTFTQTGDASVYQVDAVEWGLCTVDVVAGVPPTKFGKVYAVNTASADTGKVTTVSTGYVEVKGYFNREISPNVWEIFIQL
jgi:hypothetical protein